MVLADLKALAGQLGIKGTSGMRKGDLVAAISARQSGGNGHGAESAPAAAPTARHHRRRTANCRSTCRRRSVAGAPPAARPAPREGQPRPRHRR